MVTDPIADMLTRIRNANIALSSEVRMPASKLKEEVAGILEAQGFIAGFDVQASGPGRELVIKMKYRDDRERVIQGLKRVSKPGRRIYSKSTEIPRVQGGLGVSILSTSQGVLVDGDARRRKLGGEILCEVW